MASFNFTVKQMTAKIVYYGPGLCGKTTNLQYIHDHTAGDARGEMVSLETETDRTLFFDLLPIEVGTIAGFKARIQLYTVPGQVFYNTTRKLVLKGADGVVFVADSQRSMFAANQESLGNLKANLDELGISLNTLPIVFQFNKRDLPSVSSSQELEQGLEINGAPRIEACAVNGYGVFETLRAISKRTLESLKGQLENGTPIADTRQSEPRNTYHDIGNAATPSASASHMDNHPPEPAAPPPGPPQTQAASRKPVAPPPAKASLPRARLLLNLKKPQFDRARRVRLSLRVEDAERRVVQEFREVGIDLDQTSASEDVRFQVELRPTSGD